MSDLIVQPVEITEIKEHPDADRLEIAVVGGWDIITGKGNYSVGDVVVHIQPDSMITRKWAEEWEVANYLSWKKESDIGRVRVAKLRGIPSYGFLVPNETGAEVGTDMTEHYGVQKYEPPAPPLGSGIVRYEHPLFHRYTDIQNLRNYKDYHDYDELVVVTEKIHGTNSRVGWVRDDNGDLELCVGSHNRQCEVDNCGVFGTPLNADILHNLEKARDWFLACIPDLNSLIFYGEIFGAGVQDLHYGYKKTKGYALFDISVNGEYMNAKAFFDLCELISLPTVPKVAVGVFTFEDLLEMANGTTIESDDHIREGVVVRPYVIERVWRKGTRAPTGHRMIYKVINPDYLIRKGGTEYH